MTDTSSTSHGVPSPSSGRHPVDIGHLVMGVAFIGMVGVWALFEGGLVEGTDLNWFLPLPWLAAGAAGLAAVTVNSRRRARREPAADDQLYAAGYAAGWAQPYESYAPPYETPYETPYDTPYEPSYEQPDDHPYDSVEETTTDTGTDTGADTGGDTTPERPDTPEENR